MGGMVGASLSGVVGEKKMTEGAAPSLMNGGGRRNHVLSSNF